MTTHPNETEVKISISDPAMMVAKLRSLDFHESVPRQFEANTLYDTPENRLRASGTLIRLRQYGVENVITWKGPEISGRHKSRPELETKVDSVEIMHKILTSIGFQPSFRYEKYRTEWKSEKESGVVTIDETPIGVFMELEGPGEWIDRTAARLGFAPQDYVLDSYGRLYIADCERQGVTPHYMVFKYDS